MDDWTRTPMTRFIGDGCAVTTYEDYDEDSKQTIRENGVRNMLINQRLFRILQHFNDHDIPVIIMKGCHLIQSMYPFGVRPIQDIDLLFDRKYYAKAHAIVSHLGYQRQTEHLDLWTHLEVSNKLTYLGDEHPQIPVDFHFTLGPYPYLGRVPFESLLQHTEELTVGQTSFLVLRPEMLLIHLCLHLFQHQDEQWKISAYDISTVTTLRQDTLDWALFVSIVKKYRLCLPTEYAISKAATMTAVPIPIWVMDQIRFASVAKTEHCIFQRSLAVTDLMDKYLIQFLTLPNLRLKVQCLARILLPSKGFLQQYYRGNYLRYISSSSYRGIRAFLQAHN